MGAGVKTKVFPRTQRIIIVMDDIAELCASIDRERIQRARRSSVEQKVLNGGRLFDAVRVRMISGIRWQFPEYDETQVEAEFRRRLRLSRRLELLHVE